MEYNNSFSRVLALSLSAFLLATTPVFASAERPRPTCDSNVVSTPRHVQQDTQNQNKPWGGKFVGNMLHVDATKSLALTPEGGVAFRLVAEKTGKVTGLRFNLAQIETPVPTQPVQPNTGDCRVIKIKDGILYKTLKVVAENPNDLSAEGVGDVILSALEDDTLDQEGDAVLRRILGIIDTSGLPAGAEIAAGLLRTMDPEGEYRICPIGGSSSSSTSSSSGSTSSGSSSSGSTSSSSGSTSSSSGSTSSSSGSTSSGSSSSGSTSSSSGSTSSSSGSTSSSSGSTSSGSSSSGSTSSSSGSTSSGSSSGGSTSGIFGKVVVQLVKGDGLGKPSVNPADKLGETDANAQLPTGAGPVEITFKAPVSLVANQPYFLVFQQLEAGKKAGVIAQYVTDQTPGSIAGSTQAREGLLLEGLKSSVAGPYYQGKHGVLLRSQVAAPCAQGTACPAVLVTQWTRDNTLAVGNYELIYDDAVRTGPSVLSGPTTMQVGTTGMMSNAEEKVGGPNRVREAFYIKDAVMAQGVWFRVWEEASGQVRPAIGGGTDQAQPAPVKPLKIFIRDQNFKSLKLVEVPACAIPDRQGRQWLYAKFDSVLRLNPGVYYIVYRGESANYMTSLAVDGSKLGYKSKNIPNLGAEDVPNLGVQVTTDNGANWRSAKWVAQQADPQPGKKFDPSIHMTGGLEVTPITSRPADDEAVGEFE